MSKKQQQANPLHLDNLSRSWEDHPLVLWVTSNGRQLLIGLFSFLVLLFLIYQFTSSSTKKSEKKYVDADKQFQVFSAPITTEGDAVSAKEALAKLQALFTQYPELHAKYDGLIAQTLLYRNEGREAAGFINTALQRTGEANQPFYTEYTQTTLLIGENQHEEALRRALALRQSLLNESTEKTLFAFNLLRIALLQQKLGLKEELQTWEEWKELRTPEAQSVASLFDINGISLLNYIEFREKVLKT